MNNNEPVVIGRIKKGKTGKPLVVLILFLFIGGVIFILPSIINYFGDYNILDLIKNGEIIDFIKNHDKYLEKKDAEKNTFITTTSININKDIIINNKATIKYNNFSISDFILTNEYISYKITTSSNINFDKSNYYLELKQDDKVLYNIKLVDEIIDSKVFTFYFKEKLNSTLEVMGNIKEITDYPTIHINNSTLTCILNDTTYEYTFKDNLLINVKETKEYIDDGNNKTYLENFLEYSNKTKEINTYGTANIEENMNGFIFKSDVNLNNYTSNYKNYYSLNTNINKINFEMNSKGYDCK